MNNPKDVAFRMVTGLHEAIFLMSNGRIGGRAGGMPVLRLTTIGRKTGKRRTTMLTSPIQDGERVILVASYGGDDRHPTWFLNLRENPQVEITMQGRTRSVRAREATPEERAEWWPRVVAAYGPYEHYQRRTERVIPFVVLEP